ncbi:hypothetical protein B0T11DRAFT_11513 [Plectosphaerella cucumerina]|uniref:Uncharacterized protein n=1 Tax=Plectosphaerella cucumerina TaxID=40658 RepID=A0A8K0TV92_9PEZI|nr:hypothetical protein B0T11DRAFT_11513 [Plectosphaerella cucumerina]
MTDSERRRRLPSTHGPARSSFILKCATSLNISVVAGGYPHTAIDANVAERWHHLCRMALPLGLGLGSLPTPRIALEHAGGMSLAAAPRSSDLGLLRRVAAQFHGVSSTVSPIQHAKSGCKTYLGTGSMPTTYRRSPRQYSPVRGDVKPPPEMELYPFLGFQGIKNVADSGTARETRPWQWPGLGWTAMGLVVAFEPRMSAVVGEPHGPPNAVFGQEWRISQHENHWLESQAVWLARRSKCCSWLRNSFHTRPSDITLLYYAVRVTPGRHLPRNSDPR